MVLDGIVKCDFLVVGRVGMDFWFDFSGMCIKDVMDLKVGMGGSFVNIVVGLVKFGCKVVLVICVFDDVVGWYCEG